VHVQCVQVQRFLRAADSDARVDYGFGVAELGMHRESVDAWGLARAVALMGVSNADNGPAHQEAWHHRGRPDAHNTREVREAI
jgi:hypothetical protein